MVGRMAQVAEALFSSRLSCTSIARWPWPFSYLLLLDSVFSRESGTPFCVHLLCTLLSLCLKPTSIVFTMDYSERKETLGMPRLAEVGSDFDLPPEKAGTIYDQRDMERVGKKQELRVRTSRNAFKPLASLRDILRWDSETSASFPSWASLLC